ncbi:hypothetical protein [Niallia sp. 03190]|uniref:hypothetical protein n=1 Tax=Niallia sp. 03190 TaxID=3458061 RepID=UPI004043D464
MNLQPRKETIAGQKEFLRNTQGMQFKSAGVTLQGSDFAAGEYLKAGTAIFVDSVSGLGRKWQADTVATQTGAGLTTHDVKVIAGQNPIVGVLVAGHPLESKCTGVTANFKTATTGRLVFDI